MPPYGRTPNESAHCPLPTPSPIRQISKRQGFRHPRVASGVGWAVRLGGPDGRHENRLMNGVEGNRVLSLGGFEGAFEVGTIFMEAKACLAVAD